MLESERMIVRETVSIIEIPLSQIIPSKILIRDIEGDVVNDLRESIRQFGVLQPIMVRPVENGFFEIIFGNHRYFAAKGAGLKTIPAQVKQLSEEESILLGLSENIQRLQMNPLREGELYVKLSGSYDLKTLSVKLGKSMSYLQGRIQLYKNLHTDLRKELGCRLTTSTAIQLCKLPKEKQVVVFQEVERTKESLENQFSLHNPSFGGGCGWSDNCHCPKCGSVHVKGVNYVDDSKH